MNNNLLFREREPAQFGGFYDAFLGMTAIGTPFVAELAASENPIAKYAALGIATAAGVKLAYRLAAFETEEVGARRDLPKAIDLSGQE